MPQGTGKCLWVYCTRSWVCTEYFTICIVCVSCPTIHTRSHAECACGHDSVRCSVGCSSNSDPLILAGWSPFNLQPQRCQPQRYWCFQLCMQFFKNYKTKSRKFFVSFPTQCHWKSNSVSRMHTKSWVTIIINLMHLFFTHGLHVCRLLSHWLGIQLLKKLSQYLAVLQRLMQHKSNKLHNILKIIYVIL